MSRLLKILIAPVEISSYNKALLAGFKQIGCHADFITYRAHHLGYGGETAWPLLLRGANWFEQFRGKSKCPLWLRWICSFPSRLLRLIWAVYAIFKYDVFIFSYGQSLLPRNLDLSLIRFFGKKIISNLGFGSEARPFYLDGARHEADSSELDVETLLLGSINTKKLIAKHEKYANYVIGAPYSTFYFANQPFVNWFAIGFPSVNMPERCPGRISKNGSVIRILHAPSDPVAKGSLEIESVILRLQARGYLIEYITVAGQPFSSVLDAIQNCDFIVDQVYSDTPMAGFAREGAFFAKPAVVAGYGLARISTLISPEMLPPAECCSPEYLEKSIEKLIVDAEYRKTLGRRAQLFVLNQWGAVEVARRLLCLINDVVPGDWWVRPEKIFYLEGMGQSFAKTKAKVAKLVDAYGISALQLAHRPDLEKGFLRLIQSSLSEKGNADDTE